MSTLTELCACVAANENVAVDNNEFKRAILELLCGQRNPLLETISFSEFDPASVSGILQTATIGPTAAANWSTTARSGNIISIPLTPTHNDGYTVVTPGPSSYIEIPADGTYTIDYTAVIVEGAANGLEACIQLSTLSDVLHNSIHRPDQAGANSRTNITLTHTSTFTAGERLYFSFGSTVGQADLSSYSIRVMRIG